MSFWIYRYKITKLSPAPMYGRDVVLETHTDLTQAIDQAKRMLKNHGELCVIEHRYASEENLAKDFHFDCSVRWASWLSKEERL